MHFFQAWLDPHPFEIVRLLAPAALALIPALLPGPRNASIAAFSMAPAVVLALAGRLPWPLVALWALLWLVLAVRIAATGEAPGVRVRAGDVEAGAVGLGLSLAVVAVLIAGIAREDLGAAATRLCSAAAALLGAGLLQLMLRRHVARAAFGIAALGLAIQLLDLAARDAEIPGAARSRGLVLLATALAVALVLRIAENRERRGATPWVSDAHLLHD